MTDVASRLEIADVVARLAHGQDEQDWRAFRELFDDRVLLDLSSQFGAAPVELAADELVAKARSVREGFACTQHLSSNVLVELDADRARCRAHIVAYHHLPTTGVDFCTMRGRWELGLRRRSGRWLVDRWAVVRTGPWEGDPGLYDVAAAAAADA